MRVWAHKFGDIDAVEIPEPEEEDISIKRRNITSDLPSQQFVDRSSHDLRFYVTAKGLKEHGIYLQQSFRSSLMTLDLLASQHPTPATHSELFDSQTKKAMDLSSY
jgi:hypothetical protein